ncbi:MAG: hypothetical protein B7X11_03985 [Acidobacteria bacterium 37-65-4]|nr:MAG: hypothetical protein B7X11_03985 [Acidobacteria bacterium 37-65-4]
MPPPRVPAKILVPEAIRAFTEVKVSPLLATVQLEPLSVDLSTPPFVPAKMSGPENVKEVILGFVHGVVAAVQLVPLSVVRNRPL